MREINVTLALLERLRLCGERMRQASELRRDHTRLQTHHTLSRIERCRCPHVLHDGYFIQKPDETALRTVNMSRLHRRQAAGPSRLAPVASSPGSIRWRELSTASRDAILTCAPLPTMRYLPRSYE